MPGQIGPIFLADEAATTVFAKDLAAIVSPPLTISFSGEIGAGKTSLIRAMLRQLGIQSAIKSPSFSLLESYLLGDLLIHHFDLYRIQDEQELEYIGIRDYFSPQSLCLIEWPERLSQLPVPIDLVMRIDILATGRALSIQSLSRAGEASLAALMEKRA